MPPNPTRVTFRNATTRGTLPVCKRKRLGEIVFLQGIPFSTVRVPIYDKGEFRNAFGALLSESDLSQPLFGLPKGFHMRFPHITVAKSLLTITAVLSAGFSACASDSSSPLVIKQHTSPGGQQYFAVAVKPTDVRFSTVRRHIVLMDTSASQTGTIR